MPLEDRIQVQPDTDKPIGDLVFASEVMVLVDNTGTPVRLGAALAMGGTGGGGGISNLDGGTPTSVYLLTQNINGGTP